MTRFRHAALAVAVGLAFAATCPVAGAQPFAWSTVVNNMVLVPACGDSDGTRHFNSYSQPSVNEAGLVVFRGRSKGSDAGGEDAVLAAPTAETGAPARGVYTRDMRLLSPVSVVACVTGAVPQPNNLAAPFNEFPAFPRIDASSPAIAARGQSRPVWEYVTGYDDTTFPPTALTTKVGTSGVYTNPGGVLVTGASLLGAVRDFTTTALVFPQVSVPGAPAGTRFDQFPGAPSIAEGTVVGFKGNYTVGDVGMTGVFFRDAGALANPINVVASSAMRIPDQPAGGNVLFGSTAPPTLAGKYMFFVGLDNEDAPTLGGIYSAKMKDKEAPKLETLVKVGSQVPGEAAGVGFNRIGEGLSVSADGSFVTFWGAWGTDTFTKTLYCPSDGNADRLAYCLANDQAKVVPIPVRQGIFVYDVRRKEVRAVAKSGQDGIVDFLYWVYSGAPPGVGGGHEEEGEDESREPPKWRSSAFAAVSVTQRQAAAVAFKGSQCTVVNGTCASDPVPGIFLRNGTGPLATVALTTQVVGNSIDASLPQNAILVAVGIERDGFRGANLAITASGVYYDAVGEEKGWAGIYLTRVPLAD